jgi:hypothetical protein
MNSIPDPASKAPLAPDSGAVLLPCSAIVIIAEEESRMHPNWFCFFGAIRGFLSRLVDDSAYRDVCSGREISVVFTANGPLVFRPEPKNVVQNRPARSS